MQGTILEQIIQTIIRSAPMLAVLVVGVVMMLSRAQQRRFAARLVMAALAIFLFASFVNPFISSFIFRQLAQNGRPNQFVFSFVAAILGIPFATAVGLLLWAAMSPDENMSYRSRRRYEDDEDDEYRR